MAALSSEYRTQGRAGSSCLPRVPCMYTLDLGFSREKGARPSIETAYSYLSAIEPKRTIQLDRLSIQALPTSRDSRELMP